MPDKNLEKNIYKTYLKMIKNSEGSKMFNSFYVREKDTDKEHDVFQDGIYSGAFYISSILTIFGLINKPHSTVATIENIFKDKKDVDWGWMLANKDNLKAGDVVVYEEIEFEDGSKSDQIGFYIDENVAYSTSYKKRCVIKHHPTFDSKRKIIRAYHNKNLV